MKNRELLYQEIWHRLDKHQRKILLLQIYLTDGKARYCMGREWMQQTTLTRLQIRNIIDKLTIDALIKYIEQLED
jgi:hypothetical protein